MVQERSVASKDIKKGDIIKRDDLTFKRPASGISPKFIDDIVGRRAFCNISEDDILKWNMVE